MVKHIVVYTLKEGIDKDAAVELIASKLEPLVGQKSYRYGSRQRNRLLY